MKPKKTIFSGVGRPVNGMREGAHGCSRSLIRAARGCKGRFIASGFVMTGAWKAGFSLVAQQPIFLMAGGLR